MTEEVDPHILDQYSLLKKVGSGAYGHVWKVKDKQNGNILALKKIFDAFQHSTDAQRTFREIVFLHELSHPNIIKLWNVVQSQSHQDLYLVFEFMEADLHNAIGQKVLKDIHNRFIVYQIVKAMKFLHSAELIHRDLKPSNVLLNSQCEIKICDFGLARSLVSDKYGSDVVLTEEVATRWYRAPEILLGSQKYDKSADVWSIGCILAELLHGKPIFTGNSTLNQLQQIVAFTGYPSTQDISSLNSQLASSMVSSLGKINIKPIKEWFRPDTPADAINLVTGLLQFNPKRRPTCSQILSHPYLQKFHNQKEEKVCNKIIYPPVSDNKKLNLKQYRQLIYERINKIYDNSNNARRQSMDSTPITKMPSAKNIHHSVKQTEPDPPNNFEKIMGMENKGKPNNTFSQTHSFSQFPKQGENSNVVNGKVVERKSSLKEMMHTKKISRGEIQQQQQWQTQPFSYHKSPSFQQQARQQQPRQQIFINTSMHQPNVHQTNMKKGENNVPLHGKSGTIGRGVKINNGAALYKENKLGRNASATTLNKNYH